MKRRKPDDMRFVDNYVNHWEGTVAPHNRTAQDVAQCSYEHARESAAAMQRAAGQRINAEMAQAMQIPIFNPDQMQSQSLIGGRSAGRSRNIPMEDRWTHDINIGRQRDIVGPHIPRPFARIIPDGHKATIFDNTKWEQIGNSLAGILKYGRNEFFELSGKLYVENWKRLWKKTRDDAEALSEKKNGR